MTSFGRVSRGMLLAAVLLLGTVPSPPAALAAADPGVLPPQSSAFGKSLGAWSAAWWQWAFAIPTGQNPLLDDSGANCGVGQAGKVWFLGGTFALTENPSTHDVVGTASRTCSIPNGTAVLIPIINAECSTIEGNGTTEAELRACARGFMDGVTVLTADVDGRSVSNPRQYRATSPLFSFTLPSDNLLGKPAGTSPSVSDGFYLLLAPPSVGAHSIHVHGEAPLSPTSSFILDVTYALTVKK